MKEIDAVVRSIRFRIDAARFLQMSLFLGSGLLLLTALGIAGTRVLSLDLPLVSVASLFVPVSFALVVVWILKTRADLVTTATEADLRLGLETRLSSAILLSLGPDAMAKAAIEDATVWASRVNPRHSFEVKPRRGWRLFLTGLALVPASTLTPRLDLLNLEEERSERNAEKSRVDTVLQNLESQAEGLQEEAARLGLELPEALLNPETLSSPDLDGAQRRQAILEELEELRDKMLSERAKQGPSSSSSIAPSSLPREARKLAEALDRRDQELLEKGLSELSQSLAKSGLELPAVQRLGTSLRSLAENLPANEDLAKSLNEASKALSLGDVATAISALESALEKSEEVQRLWEQQKLLEQTLAELDRATRQLGSIRDLCEDCLKRDCNRCRQGGEP